MRYGRLECIFSNQQYRYIKNKVYEDIYVLDKNKLRTSTYYECDRKVYMAKREGEKGNLRKCLKYLFISTRFLYLGMNIVKHGRITDYTGVNHIWSEMKTDFDKNNFKDWTEYFDKYEGVIKKMKREFKKICPYEKNYNNKNYTKNKHMLKSLTSNHLDQEFINEDKISKIKVVNFLNKYGLEALCERTRITYKRHSKYYNLVQLVYSQMDDFNEQLVRECR